MKKLVTIMFQLTWISIFSRLTFIVIHMKTVEFTFPVVFLLTLVYAGLVQWGMEMLKDKLKTTSLTRVNKDFLYDIDVTTCCKIGPITTEKFCSSCGKKIERR